MQAGLHPRPCEIFLSANSLILTPKPRMLVQVIDIPDRDLFEENGFIKWLYRFIEVSQLSLLSVIYF